MSVLKEYKRPFVVCSERFIIGVGIVGGKRAFFGLFQRLFKSSYVWRKFNNFFKNACIDKRSFDPGSEWPRAAVFSMPTPQKSALKTPKMAPKSADEKKRVFQR